MTAKKYQVALLMELFFLMFLVKLPAQGWEQVFVRAQNIGKINAKILGTTDGGLLIYQTLFTVPARDSQRMIIIKLDASGQIQWERLHPERISLILQTDGGGYRTYGSGYRELQIDSLSPGGRWIKRDRIAMPDWFHTPSVYRGGDDHLFLVQDQVSGQPVRLLKITKDGGILWEREFAPFRIHDVSQLLSDGAGGGYLIHIIEFTEGEEWSRVIARFDQNGDDIWDTDSLFVEHLYLDQESNRLYGVAHDELSVLDPSSGEVVFQNAVTMPGNVFEGFHWIEPQGNHLYIGGGSGVSSDGDITLVKTDLDGDILLSRTFGSQVADEALFGMAAMPNNGLAILGNTNLYANHPDFPAGTDFYLILTDSLGRSITNYVRGSIYIDQGEECVPDSTESKLAGWFVKISNEERLYFGLTDENGDYQVRVDTGAYQVEVLPPNIYWEACEPVQRIEMDIQFDTVTVDFSMQSVYECPLLRVDVSTPFLRRCYENTYTVKYCNEGTVTAENATLEVLLDSFLLPQSSTPSWDEHIGQELQYSIGVVEPGQCGEIRIRVTVDCENTLIGQSHCVEARVFPDTLCTPPGINWDGSSLEVSGRCLGDSVEFTIQNVGLDMTMPSSFTVIENDVIYFGGTIQLPAGESRVITTFANGNTFGLSAKQPDGHPGSSNPFVIIEGCAALDNDPEFGFVTTNPFDEGDPFIAIDCQENRGSWDPNDIQAFPRGVGDERLLGREVDIEYKIRFQNTGTDTAFMVVIRDTLPAELDIASFQAGAASHPYTCEVLNGNILEFTFSNIMLPDSNVNEPASHGAVQYKISQVKGLLPGSEIRNRAGIYFDFNAPVITNTAWHTIRKPIRLGIEEGGENCSFAALQPQMVMTIDTVEYPEFDSLYLWSGMVLPAQLIEIDTTLNAGGTVAGKVYLADSLHLEEWVNQYGCDSIVRLDISIDPLSGLPGVSEVRVFPNPAPGEGPALGFRLGEALLLAIDLFDAAGRFVQEIYPGNYTEPGDKLLKVDATNLPAGLYFLRMKAGGAVVIRKVIIR